MKSLYWHKFEKCDNSVLKNAHIDGANMFYDNRKRENSFSSLFFYVFKRSCIILVRFTFIISQVY